jgi:ATP-dependent helicase/DNAse subunit B
MAELNGVNGKKLAGLFYAPVSDAYGEQYKKTEYLFDGKVLDEDGVMKLHGEMDEKTAEYIKVSSKTKKTVVLKLDALTAHVKYAIRMCEKAVESMENGLIASSPYKGACEYCAFSGVCDRESFPTREVADVSADTIINAVKGEDL